MGALMPAAAFAEILAAYNPPPLDRTDMLQEALIAGGIIAVAFAVGFALLAATGRRRKAAGALAGSSQGGPAPGGANPDAPGGHLALKDGEQAADDAEVEQELRNRFMDRRITRGKDVNDGILTAISSVAKTLESTRVKIYTDPYGYEQQVHQMVLKLELALRDLRACVLGPSSRFVRTTEFTAALERALSELRVEFGAQFDVQVDEDAVAHLVPEQLDCLLKVAREAATNALRHGRSRLVSIKLQRVDASSQLVVQDNGRGFVPDQAEGKGKGLPLMRTLAEEAGGRFEVTTRIGNGARAVVTVPSAPAKA